MMNPIALQNELLRISSDVGNCQYLTECTETVRRHLEAAACFVVRQKDERTAEIFCTNPVESVLFGLIDPGYLHQLTAQRTFFTVDSFKAPRTLRSVLGHCSQLAVLYLDRPELRAWLIAGWTDNRPSDSQTLELALLMLKEKALLYFLAVQNNNITGQYNFLFTHSPQAVIRINQLDNSSWVNEAAIELLELPPGNYNPAVAAVSAGMMRLFKNATNHGELGEIASQLFTNTGSVAREWIWNLGDKVYSVLSRLLSTEHFRGRIWLFNDITDLYNTYQRVQKQQQLLTQRNDDLAEANREIESLISVIAHDLKSPLAVISAIFHQMAAQENLLPDQLDNIEYGIRTVRRGVDLINSIVFYNSLMYADQPLHISEVEIDDLVDALAAGYEVQARQKDIQLHVRKADASLIVHSDFELLVRILDNLISNALKFTPLGRNVYISVYQQDNTCYIDVRDEGPGLNDDDRRRLFKRFQRLSAQPTNQESSSGLGLSIVKALTTKLGASIEVDSIPGAGSTFRLGLPITTDVTPESPHLLKVAQ